MAMVNVKPEVWAAQMDLLLETELLTSAVHDVDHVGWHQASVALLVVTPVDADVTRRSTIFLSLPLIVLAEYSILP